MAEPRSRRERFSASRHWLLGLAVGLTTIWLIGGVVYVLRLGGWGAFFDLAATDLGGFLEGFFAPLAFLWLVIGLFVQQREVASNTEALRQTNLISEQQTNVLAATELRARQNAFFQIADHVRKQTSTLMGMLLNSLEDKNGEPFIPEDDMERYWLDHLAGNSERFTALLAQPDSPYEAAGLTPYDIYYKSGERASLTTEFVRSFRGLLTIANECDTDGMIVRTVTQSPHGQVYAQMLENIVPPVCWALLDENWFGLTGAVLYAPPDDSEAVAAGNWKMQAQTRYGEQEWVSTIEQSEQSVTGYTGKITFDSDVTEIQDITISGAAMFARVRNESYAFVIIAVIRGDEIIGRVEVRDGEFARFEGVRI